MSFENFSVTETAAGYTWYFGDAITSSLPSPGHVYEVPGTYTVTLEMSTSGYCVQDLAETKTAFVEVYPKPTPGFDIEPNVVDILEPLVRSPTSVPGRFSIFASVMAGRAMNPTRSTSSRVPACSISRRRSSMNTAVRQWRSGEVGVNGTLFYAPQQLTPNNDGINDAWQPVTTGTAAYRCTVSTTGGRGHFRNGGPRCRVARRGQGWGALRPQWAVFVSGVPRYQLRIPFEYTGQIQLFRQIRSDCLNFSPNKQETCTVIASRIGDRGPS